MPGLMVCGCGNVWEEGPTYGRDFSCDKCGADYNSGGQRLADRSQWGEETGEHPADVARAFNGCDNEREDE